MTSLYALTDQFKGIQAMALDPDSSPEDFADTLEGLEGMFEAKATGIHAVLVNMDGPIMGLEKEIARLTKMKRSAENRKSRLREYLRSNMEAANIPKIKTDLFSMSLTKPKAIVVIDNEADIASEFMRITSAPDRAAIKVALEEGQEIAGAHMGEGQSGLTIR